MSSLLVIPCLKEVLVEQISLEVVCFRLLVVFENLHSFPTLLLFILGMDHRHLSVSSYLITLIWTDKTQVK